MENAQRCSNKTVPWFFAVLGETVAVTALNLLPYFLKSFLEKDDLFLFNAVLGVPFAFLSLFSLAFFRAVNRRRFFETLCRERGAKLKKSSVFGSAVLSLIVFSLKTALFLLFFFPTAGAFFAFKKASKDLPLEATVCLFAFTVLLFLTGVFFYRKVAAFFFLTEYIYLIYPHLSAASCIKMSADIISARMKDCRKLKRRLFFCTLSCAFVFFVPQSLHRRRVLKNSFAFDFLFRPAADGE